MKNILEEVRVKIRRSIRPLPLAQEEMLVPLSTLVAEDVEEINGFMILICQFWLSFLSHNTVSFLDIII